MQQIPKRIFFILIITEIMILAAIPWIDGVLVKKNYLHIMHHINEERTLKIDLLEYDQGWFTSYAKLNVTVVNGAFFSLAQDTTAPPRPLPISFVIDEYIGHGPIIYNRLKKQIQFGYAKILSNVRLSDSLEEALLGSIQKKLVFQIDTLFTFMNRWRSQLHIPKMMIESPTFGKIIWNGLDGDSSIRINKEGIRHIKLQLQIGRLLLKSYGPKRLFNDLMIDPMKYKYSASIVSGVWTGESSLYTPQLIAEMTNGLRLIAKPFVLNTMFGFGNQIFYNTNVVVNIQKLITSSKDFPLFSPLYLKLSANNFSVEKLNDYLNLLKSKQQNQQTTTINFDTLESLLVSFAVPGSFFESEMSMNTSLGTLNLNSKTTWDPSEQTKIAEIIKGLHTTVYVKASIPMATKLAELYGDKLIATVPMSEPDKPKTPHDLIHDLVLIGYLGQDQNDYVTSITIDGDIWKINGKLLPNNTAQVPQKQKNLNE